MSQKQNKLIPGKNITISGNKISASQQNLSNSTKDIAVKSLSVKGPTWLRGNSSIRKKNPYLTIVDTDHPDKDAAHMNIHVNSGKGYLLGPKNRHLQMIDLKTMKTTFGGDVTVNGTINELTKSEIKDLKELLEYLNKYPDLQVAFGEAELSKRQLQCYLNRYGDLRRAFGKNNLKEANKHWKNHGRQEGRNPKCDDELTHREAQCYLDRYRDLRGAFGSKNVSKAKTHWHNNGKKEGRNPKCDD